jgi:hypothetical protein
MSVSKPSVLPRWAITLLGALSSRVEEPPSGKKDVGWAPGDTVPAEWLNWLFVHTYKWIEWLNQQTTSAEHFKTILPTEVVTASRVIVVQVASSLPVEPYLRYDSNATTEPAGNYFQVFFDVKKGETVTGVQIDCLTSDPVGTYFVKLQVDKREYASTGYNSTTLLPNTTQNIVPDSGRQWYSFPFTSTFTNDGQLRLIIQTSIGYAASGIYGIRLSYNSSPL